MTRCLAAAVAALIALACGPAAAQSVECYPLKTIRAAAQVMLPRNTSAEITGGDARAYLEAYNAIGNRTDFDGDDLFISITPTGLRLVIPIVDGIGCPALGFLVVPRVHQLIIARIARSKT